MSPQKSSVILENTIKRYITAGILKHNATFWATAIVLHPEIQIYVFDYL